MAIEGQVDRAFLNNGHEQAFTISGVNLTSRHVKWAISLRDALTGVFDPAAPLLQKTNQTPGNMTDVDLPNGKITVNILPADTASLAAGEYEFQLEVFNNSGVDGVITSSGVLTLEANIVETV